MSAYSQKRTSERFSWLNPEKALSGCLVHLTVPQSLKDYTRNLCAERFLMSPLDKTVLVVEDKERVSLQGFTAAHETYLGQIGE